MWPIAYTGPEGAYAFMIYTSITLFIDASIGWLGVIFWILAIDVDKTKIENEFLWHLIGTITVDLIIMVHNFISIEALRSWYTFKMAKDTEDGDCTNIQECLSKE